MPKTLQEQLCVKSPESSLDRTEQRLIVQALIDRARAAPERSRAALWLGPVTALLLWASFTPLDWGWVAWFALAPLLCLARSPRPMRGTYLGTCLAGAVFWIPTLQWMRLGDATMYPAWGAMAIYASLYFPAFMFATRIALHRLSVPLVIAAPVAWVGLELVRAHLLTGFAWYLLGHTQHRWAAMTQISDLVGGYGVSFVVMLVNACLASLVPIAWLRRYRITSEVLSETESRNLRGSFFGRLVAVGGTLGVVIATWIYGFTRMQTVFTAGPRVGLLQGNFPSSVQPPPGQDDQIFRTYRTLNGLAVQHQAEIIIWPESMMPYQILESAESKTDQQLAALHPLIPTERWKDRTVQRVLKSMAEESRASLIVGASTYIGLPDEDRAQHYNSAVYVQPSGIQGRYDKIHRVPFGEYIPYAQVLPFLSSFTPYAEGFGLDAGRKVGIFRHQQYRLLPLICFEDTVPHLVRNAVEVSRSDDPATASDVDCLVNLTNDGWFHGSSEHDQHLITASFRCIETRVPMVRAVNTGISAIIDGNGQLRDPDVIVDLDKWKAREPHERKTLIDPATGKLPKLTNIVQVGHVPLDPRTSFYVRWGDWFALTCLGLTLFGVAFGFIVGQPSHAMPPTG